MLALLDNCLGWRVRALGAKLALLCYLGLKELLLPLAAVLLLELA